VLLLLVLGHLKPLEDEIKLCELLESIAAGGSLLLVQFMKDFLDFLEVVNDLNLCCDDVLDKVFISFPETVSYSGLRQSLLRVEDLLQTQVPHGNRSGWVFSKVFDMLDGGAIVHSNSDNS
jgi:hypothetical protein